ncbi:MAG: DNA mismatch repair protein [Chlorobiaceae bacterium]|jgi:hypothetical protein|nr:DNA mismatch repair protein [Chlorobiaceae bacterium]
MTEKTCTVKVQGDHIKKLTSANPEHALAELIWNGVDADASNVDVIIEGNALRGIELIIIRDNGTAFSLQDAEIFFSSLGGSWKSKKNKSNKGRFLHGKEGQGRFKAFALGRYVEWHVNYKGKKGDGNSRFIITGYSEDLQRFTIKEVESNDAKVPGVVVKIYDLNKQFKVFKSGNIIDKLLPIFCLYLQNYPDVKITVAGDAVDVAKAVKKSVSFELDAVRYKGKSYSVVLDLIEWVDIEVRDLWYCDQGLVPLLKYDKQIRGIGDYGFSAYLRSSLIERMNAENVLELDGFDEVIKTLSDSAIKKIKEYFIERALEDGQEQIRKWKIDEIYPYKEDATTPIEVAERQMFDIVAVKIEESLPSQDGNSKKEKAFQLRMLRQVVESSPDALQKIITEVLNLPADSREALSGLLQDISLTGMINASKLVADRLRFIVGLEGILFDGDGKKTLKERSQLHRMIAENTWVFGPEFTVSVDDKSLTEVLRKHRSLLGLELIVDDAVKTIDGKVGIVDLMLSRQLPTTREDELEHLVIELKAPKVKVGEDECGQIKKYAYAVIADERFASLKVRWNFWVISNEMDQYAINETTQEGRPQGLLYKNKEGNVMIWVKTWSQIIRENKYRLEFVRDKLNYDVDKIDGVQYMRNTYAKFLKGVIVDDEMLVPKDSEDVLIVD